MRKVSGFVTIEYSLLLPLLYMLYTCLIYVALYEYNQCLLQTECYFVALGQRKIVCQNKYLLAEDIEIDYTSKGHEISVKAEGTMSSPLFVMGIGRKKWYLQSEIGADIYAPTKILRLFKEMWHGG